MGDVPKLLLSLLNTVQHFVGLQCTKVRMALNSSDSYCTPSCSSPFGTTFARSYRHLTGILWVLDRESLQAVLMAVLEVNLSRVLELLSPPTSHTANRVDESIDAQDTRVGGFFETG